MSKYRGMPELQEFLIEIGFSLHQGFLDVGSTANQCNWYACRTVPISTTAIILKA